MKRFNIIACAAALTACSPAAGPTSTTAPAEAPASDKPAASATLTPALLVGRWGDNGDCTRDIVINADGTFASFTGGSGAWSLNGDRMTMTGANGPFEVGVSILNQNTLVITNPDGSVGTSQRC